MKPEIAYLLTADHVLLEENGKPSVIGIFHDITLPKEMVSLTLPQFVVFVRVVNAVGAKSAEVIIYDPEGEKFADVKLGGKEENTMAHLNLRAIFTLVQFVKIGTYKIKVVIDGNELESKEHNGFSIFRNDD